MLSSLLPETDKEREGVELRRTTTDRCFYRVTKLEFPLPRGTEYIVLVDIKDEIMRLGFHGATERKCFDNYREAIAAYFKFQDHYK